MALLGSFLRAVLAGIVMLGLAYIGDIIYTSLENSADLAADSLNVTRATRYGSAANTYVSAVAWLGLMVLAGIFLVYAIHVRRR